MEDKRLLENLVTLSTLQLQVLLEMRALLVRSSQHAVTEYEHVLADVADHACMQRQKVLDALSQTPD